MARPVQLTDNVEKYDIADKVIGQGQVWGLIGSPVTGKAHSSRQARDPGTIVGRTVGTLAPPAALTAPALCPNVSPGNCQVLDNNLAMCQTL